MRLMVHHVRLQIRRQSAEEELQRFSAAFRKACNDHIAVFCADAVDMEFQHQIQCRGDFLTIEILADLRLDIFKYTDSGS